jgi:hypothetical protein
MPVPLTRDGAERAFACLRRPVIVGAHPAEAERPLAPTRTGRRRRGGNSPQSPSAQDCEPAFVGPIRRGSYAKQEGSLLFAGLTGTSIPEMREKDSLRGTFAVAIQGMA